MTGTQYKNVAQWTLANTPEIGAMDSVAAARAIFNNMGVAFPNGSCRQVLLTLMSEDYMGWMPCTYRQSQEFANAGTAAVGIDADHVVVILPDDNADALIGNILPAEAAVMDTNVKTAGAIAPSERLAMQFYYYSPASTTYRPWSYYANKVVDIAVAQLGKTYNDFKNNQDGISFTNGYWCVQFVRWCFKKAGVYQSNIISNDSSSTYLRDWYDRNQPDRIHKGPDGVQPGDIVFIATKDTDANPTHTCIATSTRYSSGKVNTINGNWGSKVAYQTFPITGYVFGWYAHPNYELAN